MVLAANNGHVYQSADYTMDNNSTPIACVLGTFEWDAGDLRAAYDYGDAWIDVSPSGNVNVQPVSQGNNISGATVIPQGNRSFAPVSVGGIVTGLDFIGLQINWSETFNGNNATVLHAWDLSTLPRPEMTQDRVGDWMGSMRG